MHPLTVISLESGQIPVFYACILLRVCNGIPHFSSKLYYPYLTREILLCGVFKNALLRFNKGSPKTRKKNCLHICSRNSGLSRQTNAIFCICIIFYDFIALHSKWHPNCVNIFSIIIAERCFRKQARGISLTFEGISRSQKH